jgi:nucleotide-binding universal stress UspA family protein
MRYATVMTAPTVGRSNADLLLATHALAERFSAKVIGVAACRPIAVVCPDLSLPAPCFDEDRKQIKRQLDEAEGEFRAFLKAQANRIEWRTATTVLPFAVHLAQEARDADLVVVPIHHPRDGLDTTREMDVVDLVMQCSRPVVLVPTAAPTTFDRILLAWKDTREAQRAATDALPFLAKAQSVTVVEIASQEKMAVARAELDQVTGWLKQHGIAAQARIETPIKSNAAQLNAIADQLKADLMVAGAYGHRRGQAWLLGGVTSDVLRGGRRCVLLSH